VGNANVAAVYLLHGAKLDDRAMRLLVWMALVSLDPPGNPMLGYEPCHYWQGWEAQAEALGYVVPPRGDKSRPNVYRALQRVRGRLVEAGAIERFERTSTRTTWLLRLL
jgi:hypothetical protein